MTDATRHAESVLFCSASVGAGHNAAAAAVLEGVRRAAPEVSAEFDDVLEYVPALFRAYYAGLYAWSVTKCPRLYGWAYRRLDRPDGPERSLTERARLWKERRTTRRYLDRVLRRRPVLIVATHYLAAPQIGRLIGRGQGGMRLWVIVTDNEAHRFWYAENAERYFVANDAVADRVGRWGIPRDRITVSGIPVHPRWTEPVDPDEARRRWRLPADRPIVLVSGGTYFTVGPMTETVRALIAATDAHVVVLAGSSKRLLADLAAMPECPDRLTAVPMTSRGHELAHVASVMLTKAGGLTTTECLAKGLPMVLSKPVPGQESANAELLAREGAAVIAPTPEESVARVAELLADEDARRRMRSRARRLFRPATETITRAILDSIREHG